MAAITKSMVVNGQRRTVTAESGMPVLWVLRDMLGLTGTKYGCGIEACGACTIMVGGGIERSCDMTFSEVSGDAITTIEGLSPTGTHPVQQAWIAKQVPQCGYCQSGMILAAVQLLKHKPKPTDADIDSAMSNICVCGTYERIRAAIHQVAGN